MITKGSALLTPEGAFNGATAPNYTNWRKRDPPKHRLQLFQLEEEMGRQQGKNTLNKIKRNTTPPETSDSKTARPGHPNAGEAGENDIKNNCMKRNSKIPLKKWRKRQKKWKKFF